MFLKIFVLLALFLLGIGAAVYFYIKEKIKWYVPAAAFVAVLMLSAVVFAVPSCRAFFNVPVLTARGAAELFCAAVNDSDAEREKALLKAESSLYSNEPCSDEAAEHIRRYLLSELNLELVAEPEMGWNGAAIKLRAAFPDVPSGTEAVASECVRALEEIGAQRPRSVVYSADKKYLPEVIDEALIVEMEKLESSGYPLLYADIELTVTCEKGQWIIISDEPLSSALRASFGDAGSLAQAIDSYAADIKRSIASEAKYVEKHFVLDINDTVAPEPDKERFGATTDPAEVQAVVEQASELLKGQPLVWNRDIAFYPGTEIRYYFDDTILAIVWREERNGTLCTFSEIKLADASQFRRKLVDDMFNPPTSDWKEATLLSDDVNAVVATGSDLYAFRDVGIFSHNGVLFRCNPSLVESCHITRSGDMLFTKRYELYSWEEAQQWITDNDIVYSFAFGPRLIENGEPITTWEYSVGEIWEGYARAAMGQLGEKGSLHYLMAVVSSDIRVSVPELPVRRDPTLLELRDVMVEKGCTQAYTLDGGQTGAIIIDNEMITRPTYGWERIYCDIIYFATALTPEERLG